MAESRNKKYSSERNQLVAMPPIVTTVLGTELGTTLLFGFKQQHHCRDGLLPLLVTLPLIMAESRPSSSSVLARPRGWHAFVERLGGTFVVHNRMQRIFSSAGAFSKDFGVHVRVEGAR